MKKLLYLIAACMLLPALPLPVSAAEADPSAYTAGYSVGEDGTFIITNSYEPEKTAVKGGIVWSDSSNQDGIRPQTVTVSLYNGEDPVSGKSVGLSAEDARSGNGNIWEYEFADVPVYQDHGTPVEYSVRVTSEAPESYVYEFDAASDPFYTAGIHEAAAHDLTVTLVFDDDGNRDGIRPEEASVQLKMNGESDGDPEDVTEGGSWTFVFTELPDNVPGAVGTPAVYSVTLSDPVDGYTEGVWDPENGTLTLTHTPETVSVSVLKHWDDDHDRDGIRPDSICVTLSGDDDDLQAEISGSADDWTHVFADVHRFRNGEEISYQISESAECEASGNPD